MSKEQKESEHIDYVASRAPSYLNLLDDGADNHCTECTDPETGVDTHLNHRKGYLFCFMPDGRRLVIHRECVDEDWLKNAICYGAI